MLWVFLICTLAVYFYMTVRKRQSYWQDLGVEHAEPKFFLGSMEIIQTTPFIEKIRAIYNQFPGTRYIGLYTFLEPILMIKDPDLIKQITVKEFDHFTDHRNVVDRDVDPIWGKSLINSEGERWRDLRSTLSPSFTSSKLKIMYNLINDCALEFVGYFKNDPSETVEIEAKEILSRYTNDVVATVAFGLKCNSLIDRKSKFYEMGSQISTIRGLRFLRFFAHTTAPTLSRLFKIRVIPENLANYFSNIIKETVKTREEKKIIRPDMIHLLLEAQKGRQIKEEEIKVDEGFSSVSESDIFKSRRKQQITIEDIIAQALIFFLAGFETVSTILSFVFYELALHPEIQNRLREEINGIEHLTYENLFKMKYLDMVISEGLRKWPPGFVTDRRVTKAFTIKPVNPGEKRIHLKENMTVWLPIFPIHRDPKYYPEPDKFDPERFNDENKDKIHPIMYLPFGAGPRNCIGSRFALLEAKILLFHVVKNFELVPIKKTPVPLVLDPKIVRLYPKGGMWVGLKKIK